MIRDSLIIILSNTVLFIASMNSFAQTSLKHRGFQMYETSHDQSFSQEVNDSIESFTAIKINPLEWLYDDVRLSFAYPISHKVSLELRIGYRNTVLNPYEQKHEYVDYTFFNDSIGDYQTLEYNSSGVNIGIAGNFFLSEYWYIQPSFLYKRYKYIFADEYTWQEGPMSYLECYNNERTDYLKQVVAFEIRCGKVFFVRKFLIDLYSGIGLRYKWRELLENNYDWIYHSGYSRQYYLDTTLPSIHLGISIGFKL